MACDRIVLSRDKSVALTEVLSCCATMLECLQHHHLRLRQDTMMRRQKPDLLLFKTIAET